MLTRAKGHGKHEGKVGDFREQLTKPTNTGGAVGRASTGVTKTHFSINCTLTVQLNICLLICLFLDFDHRLLLSELVITL